MQPLLRQSACDTIATLVCHACSWAGTPYVFHGAPPDNDHSAVNLFCCLYVVSRFLPALNALTVMKVDE